MIKLLDKPILPSLPCAGSFVGIKILANLISYGIKLPFCCFWVQFSENIPTTLICKFEQTIFIAAEQNTDVNELKEFCNIIGFNAIHADACLLDKMKFNNIHKYEVLFLKQSGIPRNTSFSSTKLKKVYDIIYYEDNKNLLKTDWESWYADLSHRIRHGTAAAVYNENAACVASHITNTSAIISGVAALPNKRGIRHGSKILNEIISLLKWRNIFVAADLNVAPFYKKNHFITIGTVGIYKAKED